MKRCARCKLLLEESEFNWIKKGSKLSYNCKECSRLYIRQHYERNKQYYSLKAKKSRAKNRQSNFDYIRRYLETHPCVDCGEKDILVLEFDHKSANAKSGNIGDLVKLHATVTKLSEEISKCEVRCANCHRRKTLKETNSWRLVQAPVA